MKSNVKYIQLDELVRQIQPDLNELARAAHQRGISAEDIQACWGRAVDRLRWFLDDPGDFLGTAFRIELKQIKPENASEGRRPGASQA